VSKSTPKINWCHYLIKYYRCSKIFSN